MSRAASGDARVARHHPLLPPGTTSIGAAQIGGQAMAVVTAVLLARRLGASGFGVYAVVTAIVFVANVVTTFGTDLVLIREIARDRRLDRCVTALALQVSLSLVAIALIAAVSSVADTSFAGPARILSLSLLPAACFSVASATMRGLGHTRAYATLVVTAAAVPLVAVTAFVQHRDSPERTMVVLLVAQVVTASLATALCVGPVRAAHASFRVRRADVATMLRSSGTVGALGLAGVLYQRLALVGVSVLVGPTAAGWYSGASRMSEASKVGHVAMATAAYPLMAERHTLPPDDPINGLLRRGWTASIALAAAVTVLLLTVGPSLIEHLYGDGFAPARRGLTVLAVGIVPSTAATLLTLSMLADRRERDVLHTMAIGLAVLVLGTVVLVPTIGWLGACWAMTIADVTQAAALTAVHRRRHASTGVDGTAPAVLRVAS